LSEDIETELKDWFAGAKKVVVAGIGNSMRSDDYVGPRIVEGLQGKVGCDVLLLECETVPESYILHIEEFKPTHVLLVDAAEMGLEVGDTKLLAAESLPQTPAISSHGLSLRVFCEYLKKTNDAKIALLLVQPESMEFDEGLTPKVQASAKKLTETLLTLLR
jgi:hydrogenase 3 maturation protease